MNKENRPAYPVHKPFSSASAQKAFAEKQANLISPRKTIKISATNKFDNTLKDFIPKQGFEDRNHSPRVMQDGVLTIPKVQRSNGSDKSARSRVNFTQRSSPSPDPKELLKEIERI